MIYLSTFIFALLYAVKGGWLGKWPPFKKFRESRIIFDKLLDGKVLTFVGAFLFGLYFFGLDQWYQALLLAGAWLLGVAPSMGEEAGAVGDYKGGWGDYVEHSESFGREYGIKKAIQRGVFTTAPMVLVTGNVPLLVAGASMPIVYFVGNCFSRYVMKEKGWAYSEVLYGAVIGLAFVMGA